MKIVIQHTRTHLFLSKSGQWVKNDLDAATFGDSAAALHFGLKQDLANFQVVMRLGRRITAVRARIGENPREFPAVPPPEARLRA